jgi:hypothetical protein
MNLNNLRSIFYNNGCQRIYVKKLSPNDNSKNQIYLGGSFEILNIFPLSNIIVESVGDWKRERFKASLNFSWIGDDTSSYPAPKSQFVLYPKYPEVRFSGFLSGCQNPPSDLMTQRLEGRLLFLAVAQNGIVLGYIASPDSEIAEEFTNLNITTAMGVFQVMELITFASTKQSLLEELRKINLKDWINSKRLDSNGNILPCISPNCGGYTLEAELGITPNGYSEPDYLGWEIKQFGVKKFDLINSSIITLMTPEPTGGFYVSQGVKAFIFEYGYDDLSGRSDRKNFGGIHKVGEIHSRTKLKMELIGFDNESGKIMNADGKIALIDHEENEAASWSFSSLLLHWNRKHNQACYVPSICLKVPKLKYKYGNEVILGIGTDFHLFLAEMYNKNIYYDPGIKMENVSTTQNTKRRSQFRIKSINLGKLYKTSEIVTL